MNQSLKVLYEEHNGKVTDKWSLYLDEWDQVFSPYQPLEIQLLEIGIQNGGSLEIWSKYFSKASKIVGCDIDPNCALLHYDDPRVAVVIGDANTDECEEKIIQAAPGFDIIIDDGSHRSSDIVRSFGRYFPHLKEHGIYLVEDLHGSYWQNYEGGLHYPLSAISFFKRIVDIINYEHWRNNKSRASFINKFSEEYGVAFDDLQMTHIHSIQFINSLCIIKKMPPGSNILGKRKIVGNRQGVTNGSEIFNGTVIQDLATEIKDDSYLDVFELISHNKSQTEAIEGLNNAIQGLNSRLASDGQEIKTLVEQVIEKDQTVSQLVSKNAKQEGLFLDYAERIAKAEQGVRSLTIQLAESEQERKSNSTQAQELAEIKRSNAWRLVKLIWKIRSSFKLHK